MRRMLLVLGLFLVAPAAAGAQDANSIVGRSSRVYRSLASLTADFVQVIDNPMIDSAESRGTNAIRMKPQKMRAAASMRAAITGRVRFTPLKRFSITCAWISTPGTNSPSGTRCDFA